MTSLLLLMSSLCETYNVDVMSQLISSSFLLCVVSRNIVTRISQVSFFLRMSVVTSLSNRSLTGTNSTSRLQTYTSLYTDKKYKREVYIVRWMVSKLPNANRGKSRSPIPRETGLHFTNMIYVALSIIFLGYAHWRYNVTFLLFII